MKKSARIKGSLTIEASLILPFIIAVLIWFIFIAYYLHDKSILSKHTYMSALRGSQVLTGDQDVEREIYKNLNSLSKERILSSLS